MSLVKFATVCDKCGKRSEEYQAWPSCWDCYEDICPSCQVPGSHTEDERNETWCKECHG